MLVRNAERLRHARLLLLGLPLISCGGGEYGEYSAQDDATGQTEQAIVPADWVETNSAFRWSRDSNTGRFEIDVCFLGDSDAARNARGRAGDALEASWEAVSGVNFNIMGGDCSTTDDPDRIPIRLIFPGGNGGNTALGRGARHQDDPKVQIKIDYDANMPNFEAIVVHEMGHALGFVHEHGRSDWPGDWPNNNPPAVSLDSWNCATQSNGSFNDPCGGGCTNCNPNGSPAVVCYHDVDSQLPLVIPVDTQSIMAPWNCDPDRRADANNWQLSYGDRIGAEVHFPSNASRSAHGQNGFVLADRILVRRDDRLVTDWTFRGALDGVYGNLVRWTVARVGRFPVTTTGISVPASSVTVSPIQFVFTDYMGRTFSGSTNVRIDDSAHAALVMSTMAI